jgi:hypothetical protein
LIQNVPKKTETRKVMLGQWNSLEKARLPLAWGHFIALTARSSLKKTLQDHEMSIAAIQKGLLSLR